MSHALGHALRQALRAQQQEVWNWITAKVVEVMGNATGQQTHGFHLLGMPELQLHHHAAW